MHPKLEIAYMNGYIRQWLGQKYLLGEKNHHQITEKRHILIRMEF